MRIATEYRETRTYKFLINFFLRIWLTLKKSIPRGSILLGV